MRALTVGDEPIALEWLVPRQPERLTHVMLLDRERPAPYTLAVGYGSDKVTALLTLWQTLDESDAAAEAIDYVAAEYAVARAWSRRNRAPDLGSKDAKHEIRLDCGRRRYRVGTVASATDWPQWQGTPAGTRRPFASSCFTASPKETA